ncbi:peptidoglycan DD-metalloendopeptidase family protein [bacterium]|nr:peptidoglycan DD-metalloendopeptidase family protein [bacterium]
MAIAEFVMNMLKAALAANLLFLVYYFFLKDLSHFSVNRFVLNLIYPAALILAFFPIEGELQPIFSLPTTALDVAPTNMLQTENVNLEHTKPFSFLVLAYCTGLSIAFVMGIFRWIKVMMLVFLPHEKIGNMKLVLTDKTAPASFFGFVFLSPTLSQEQKEMIIAHEKWHIHLQHSLDIMLFSVYKVIFWFNPFNYFIERNLKLVHEFQVDKNVTERSAIPFERYAKCLLEMAHATHSDFQLLHQFFHHPIKTRIKMLVKKPSKPVESFKYFILLLAVFGLLFAFSINHSGQPEIRPVANAPISSGFGYRYHPVVKKSKLHNGVDFSAPKGTPVYATADGTVIEADTAKNYGIHIKIQNSDQYQTHFCHLNEMLVKVGDRVTKGQIIAKVGNTGLSMRPHLHYEVIENGKWVDPMQFMPNE